MVIAFGRDGEDGELELMSMKVAIVKEASRGFCMRMTRCDIRKWVTTRYQILRTSHDGIENVGAGVVGWFAVVKSVS